MKVLDLRCAHDHRFEGWFASEEDFLAQNEGGRIECPLCGDKAITRLPSATRLNAGSLREPAPVPPPKASPQQATAVTLQSAWTRAVQHVLANTDDVGDRFAEEARRIHYGEADERAIRGKATPDEAKALHEEGIEVMALPMPAAIKGTIQ
jgi:hypothetical protein